MLKLISLTITLTICNAIIIKDYKAYGKLLKHTVSSYDTRAASQLNTIAIPKPFESISLVKNELRKTSTPVSNAFVVDENYNFNPSYNFRYGVNDPNTGDSKFQQESLLNGVVHGSYSLAEPDGTIRKVTYTADDLNGFRATVEKLVNHEHSKTFKRIPHSSSIIKTPVPVVPVVKTVPAYQASPIYHKGLISSVLLVKHRVNH